MDVRTCTLHLSCFTDETGQVPDRVVSAEIPTVDIAGNAAVARAQVYYDGEHVFTDYMSLYRFPEGWRIVAKIFNNER